MSDDLRELQQAVREHFDAEAALDKLLTTSSVSELEIGAAELRIAKKRARLWRLAGIDEVD